MPEFIVNCTVNVQDMCQKEVLVKEDGIHYRKSCASSGACLIASSGYQQFCTGKLNSVCITCCNTPLCNGPRQKKRPQPSAAITLTKPQLPVFSLFILLLLSCSLCWQTFTHWDENVAPLTVEKTWNWNCINWDRWRMHTLKCEDALYSICSLQACFPNVKKSNKNNTALAGLIISCWSCVRWGEVEDAAVDETSIFCWEAVDSFSFVFIYYTVRWNKTYCREEEFIIHSLSLRKNISRINNSVIYSV